MDEIVSTPIIFFSGLDRTGKTTTRKHFATMTDQKYITFDRSFVDNIVYDLMFRKKEVSEEGLKKFIAKFKNLGDVYIVHLTLDLDEINNRTKRSEGFVYPIGELKDCSFLFEKYFKIVEQYGIKMIRVQCDGKSVEDIVKEVVFKLGGTNNE